MQFLYLIYVKVRLNLKSEASKSYLSYLWWVLEPALFVAIFYVVFGVFLARGSENFVTFLICGQIPFLWFSRSVNNAAGSIVAGKGLMNQVPIPKYFFPLVVVLQDFIKSIVIFLLMCVFILMMGYEVSSAWVALPIVIIVQLIFNMSLSLLGAALVPFLPDLRFIISTGTMLMMFASGVFYSYEEVLLPTHQKLFLLNPLANLIKIYRQIFMNGEFPPTIDLFLILCFSMVVIALTMLFMRKFDALYPRLASQ